ncbi:MAG: formylglycine-generating enzyme family protein [Chloroflexi bacterium]|nr:formylglycine-generating enzyme family protein [Chloroflexota bacterium]
MTNNRNRRLIIAFIIFDVLVLGAFALYKIPSPVSDMLRRQVRRVRAESAARESAGRLPVEMEATRISSTDGMTQVLVPAGEFKMGTEEKTALKNRPPHIVMLDAFWIDQTEVSNAMYAQCVEAGACVAPFEGINPFWGKSKYENHPVVYVSWDNADAYCRWAERRLPTEAEWEKAARGTDGRAYPWGDDAPNMTLANFDNLIGAPLPVDRYALGASPYGALNMAGNVREWVADWYHEFYYMATPLENPLGPPSGDRKSLRGGSYQDGAAELRAFNRLSHAPLSPGINRGFRCASDAD